jgi:hypothetical protein
MEAAPEKFYSINRRYHEPLSLFAGISPATPQQLPGIVKQHPAVLFVEQLVIQPTNRKPSIAS